MGALRGQTLIDVHDIIGKRSGKLKVLCYAGSKYAYTLGGERLRHYYACRCDCGNLTLVQRGPLKNEITRTCGCGKRGRNHGN